MLNLTDLLLIIILILVAILLVISIFKKDKNQSLNQELDRLKAELERQNQILKSEFQSNREEFQRNARNAREEQFKALNSFAKGFSDTFNQLSASQKNQLESFSNFLQRMNGSHEEKIEKLIVGNDGRHREFTEQFKALSKDSKEALVLSIHENKNEISKLIVSIAESSKELSEILQNLAKDNRNELQTGMKSFEEKTSNNMKDFSDVLRLKINEVVALQEKIKSDTELKLEKIRETVELKLNHLQKENSQKLEEMRNTVDEKLQSTLEKRFNDSFTMISQRLELVHKGLGEMQSLANSVGDIKKVMTNVKSRGILGEYQLANILEDLLTNEQYEKNVKTKVNSGAIVEFAIKMPNNNNLEKSLWLPIDSKFPKEDYESLVDAYDEGNAERIEELKRSFRAAILKNAKDIKEKYIDPPNTTEYGIMFLPFESLYAEVLRTPGLFEEIQRKYKVTITGPTTLSALLSSLQMGFRTLAIEKRSSEVWDLLGVVKTEFGKFGTVLEKTKKKLEEATNTINNAGVRTRAIERQLRKVQELPTNDVRNRIEGELNQEGIDFLDDYIQLSEEEE